MAKARMRTFLLCAGACLAGSWTGAEAAPPDVASPAAQPPAAVAPLRGPNLMSRLEDGVLRWDDAQADGRVDEAQQLFWQVRAEVDAHFVRLVQLARGASGASAQALSLSGLGFATHPRATMILVAALRLKDPRMLGNALIALNLRKDPATPLGPILAHVSRRGSLPARRYAPLAVAEVLHARSESGRPLAAATRAATLKRLGAMVEDQDAVARLHTAKALGALGVRGAVDLLLELARDDNLRVRVAASAALARTGDVRGFMAVVKVLHDTPVASKHVVRDLLGSYGGVLRGAAMGAGEIEALGLSARRWATWFNQLQAAPRAAPAVTEPLPPPAIR